MDRRNDFVGQVSDLAYNGGHRTAVIDRRYRKTEEGQKIEEGQAHEDRPRLVRQRRRPRPTRDRLMKIAP